MMLQYPAKSLLEPRKYITCQATLLQVFEAAPAEAYVICTELTPSRRATMWFAEHCTTMSLTKGSQTVAPIVGRNSGAVTLGWRFEHPWADCCARTASGGQNGRWDVR
jgi:hypothetical protein